MSLLLILDSGSNRWFCEYPGSGLSKSSFFPPPVSLLCLFCLALDYASCTDFLSDYACNLLQLGHKKHIMNKSCGFLLPLTVTEDTLQKRSLFLRVGQEYSGIHNCTSDQTYGDRNKLNRTNKLHFADWSAGEKRWEMERRKK